MSLIKDANMELQNSSNYIRKSNERSLEEKKVPVTVPPLGWTVASLHEGTLEGVRPKSYNFDYWNDQFKGLVFPQDMSTNYFRSVYNIRPTTVLPIKQPNINTLFDENIEEIRRWEVKSLEFERIREALEMMKKWENDSNFVPDLSLLDITDEFKERNVVVRLFTLFRKIHSYANKGFYIPDSGQQVPGDNQKCIYASSQPHTNDINYQIQVVYTLCNSFIYKMRTIMQETFYGVEQQSTAKNLFEMISEIIKLQLKLKRAFSTDFRHINGQFETSYKIHAGENLEVILESLLLHIRRAHFAAHSFKYCMSRLDGRENSAIAGNGALKVNFTPSESFLASTTHGPNYDNGRNSQLAIRSSVAIPQTDNSKENEHFEIGIWQPSDESKNNNTAGNGGFNGANNIRHQVGNVPNRRKFLRNHGAH